LFILPMVIAVNIRVEVRLKVKRANRMIHTVNTTLDSTPKGFNCVDMGIAGNIPLGCVLDNFMSISQLRNLIVAGQFVSEDGAIVGHMLPNHGQKCRSLNVWHYLCDCVSLALGQSYDYGFACCPTSSWSRSLPANIGFIDFDSSSQKVNLFSHEFANLVKHAPRCFVGDT